jgi:putative transposase
MDDAHLMAAVRYVENNPVAAGLVTNTADWPWSSARSHVKGRRARHDPLTDLAALLGIAPNWRAMLRHGLEAGGVGENGIAVAEAIEARLRTGRPLAAHAWIAHQESALGRPLKPARPGPKPRKGEDGGS